ncbi:helix-turn-helix domain-containing protein [Sulfitobacter sp. D35]|uniref:helix-turn-helix domain-containing protein n=1 Tax=Sulfitobacter sp. D35 TaxID=3083252 RepID=UPI00399092C1
MHRRDHSSAGFHFFEQPDYTLVVRPPGACRITVPAGRHFLDIHLGKSEAAYEISGIATATGPAPPSTFVFLPGAEEREITASRSGWSIQMSFEPSLLHAKPCNGSNGGNVPDAVKLGPCLHERDEALVVIARQLSSCWQSQSERPTLEQVDAVATLLLMRVSKNLGAPKHPEPSPSAVSRRVQSVLDHIEQDLQANHTLKSLAAVAGVSTYHFARMFREATGRSPHRYVVERRLAHAKRRLRQSDDPIVEIAYDCGFASQSHMTEVFTKVLGATPGQVRRNAP